jgi:NAD(P)-dependent dehydrogenase (short-subunit alcohol dehydrogenase family)
LVWTSIGYGAVLSAVVAGILVAVAVAVVVVSDSSAVDAAMDNVIDKLGHVSVVVANAGIGGQQAPSGDYTDEGWHRVINVNLDGVFYIQRAAIRAMKAGGRGGSVINMASILGFASSSAYAAAKHGVVGLTQTAAWEHAADGIRVNAVGPGFIHTPLVEKRLTQRSCSSSSHSTRSNDSVRRRRSPSWCPSRPATGPRSRRAPIPDRRWLRGPLESTPSPSAHLCTPQSPRGRDHETGRSADVSALAGVAARLTVGWIVEATHLLAAVMAALAGVASAAIGSSYC